MQRAPSGRRNKRRAWLGKVCLDVGALWPFWVLGTYANALGKPPVSLCCYCTWP